MIMLVAFVLFVLGFYREFRELVGQVVQIIRFIAILGQNLIDSERENGNSGIFEEEKLINLHFRCL